LRSFLKDDGEVNIYRNVVVHYVRGSQAILHVYEDAREIATVQLHQLRSKEQLHRVLRQHFELKSEEERLQDANTADNQRRHKNFQKFHRQEYVRLQHGHAESFRREVMQEPPVSWVGKDWLCNNYDRINKGFAIFRNDLLLYAEQYLIQTTESKLKR